MLAGTVTLLGAEVDIIPGIEEHFLFLVLLQLGLLLAVARGLGQLAGRIGLPSVVGELAAGVVLGPSLLGTVAPGIFESLFPPEPEQRHLLEMVGFIGVMLLLILTGLEIDLKLIASKGRQAVQVSLGGIIVPFATGFAMGQYLIPEVFLTEPGQRVTFALFLGTAMSISAIPVIAKVLIELRIIKRDIGQLTLAAGMIDDTLGWILLSVVAGLAASGAVDVSAAVRSVVTVVAVIAFSFTIGRMLIRRAARWVDNNLPGEGPMVTLMLVLAFLWAAGTQFLHIEAVLGAFIVGIIFGQIKRIDHHLIHLFETITLAVFAPIFFALAGLKVDLGALFTSQVFAIGMLVLGVAIFGKFVGAYLGAKAGRLGNWEALSLGAGMNARGALEIIIATIGFNLGILGPDMFTIIVMVAIVTSLMAPPILRFTLARVPLSETERLRLEAEERRKTSFLGNVHRLLLPTRGGSNSQLAAQLVARIVDREEIEVTTMFVRSAAAVPAEATVAAAVPASPAGDAGTLDDEADARLARVEHHLSGEITGSDLRRVIRDPAPAPADAVLAEAARGYDLLVVGATETRTRGTSAALFSEFVDRIVQDSPCPVLVVSSRHEEDPPEPIPEVPIRRILLPTTGTEMNRQAAEVAFEIAEGRDIVVDLVHIVRPSEDITVQMDPDADVQAHALAEEVLAAEAQLGHSMGATVHTEVLVTADPLQEAIVRRAADCGADLIVLRSDVKPVTQRAFFGHALDSILRDAHCPVLVVSPR